MHHLSHKVVASIPNHTTSPTTSSTGFSIRLVANNTIRRHNDGFLHLPQIVHTKLLPQPPSSASSLMANITTLRLKANTLEPLQSPQTITVHIGSGNGLRSYILKVETMNTLLPAWIQCFPCRPQVQQTNPLFDPTLSPTFRYIRSTNPLCAPPYYHPDNHLCAFRLNIPTAMSITGHLAEDHLTIGTSVIQNYLFGCSYSTMFFNNMGIYAGVISLGRSSPSLVTQAAAHGLTKFSYCLFGGTKMNRQGFLRFGTDVPHNPNYRTTKILPALNAHESEYYLSLIGVSLGGHTLDRIHPEMFARNKDNKGGCVIDIGTPLTIMVQEAYKVIEDAIWADLQHLKAERVESPRFGLCFRVTEAIKGRLQPLSLHFAEEEAVLVFSPKQLFLMMHDRQGQIACLAMMPGHRTIIGAFQQVDTRFVYDVEGFMLSFASESCILDTTEVD
ncbi:hypothetical protein QOZ80_7BG0584720 [Eleusine coracana subsp. coracana]|nr:hypothetical protein QOZ80_7BG0584720 [Eleusine coracana subsp. coracana]